MPSASLVRFNLLQIAFLSGAAVMMLELTAARVLAPAFGSSQVLWTNIIGAVLLALAAGAAVGGRVAERRMLPLTLMAATAGSFLLLYLPEPVVSLFGPEPVAELTAELPSPHVASAVAALLLFAPPVFFLGMTAPQVVAMLERTGWSPGRAGGRTLAVGTFGSLLGTYVPAHYLLDVHVDRVFLGATGLLVFCTLCAVVDWRQRR